MSITTLFANGGSQAVRIPKQYRFDAERVTIQAYRGGLLLMPIPKKPTAADFFKVCDEAGLDDFTLDRGDNAVLPPKDVF